MRRKINVSNDGRAFIGRFKGISFVALFCRRNDGEAESIILSLVHSSHNPLYESNYEMLHKITEGFIFRREDKTKKDLFSSLIDFENIQSNIFKIINQFAVQGVECLIISDAIVSMFCCDKTF